jgi:FkbM family methyltransferase
MKENLIFDVGFHEGQDTEFYLKKGYSVIAMDANPDLVAAGESKFAKYIADGRLALLNVGIGNQRGVLPFYANDDNSAFSSFDPDIGTTRGRYRVMQIPVVPLRELFDTHGTPYYAKIDIEGFDFDAVVSLREHAEKPKYISVENGQPFIIDELHSQGYRRFKFVNQAVVHEAALPNPALEGAYVQHRFEFGSSGPFGEEAPGPWLDKDMVTRVSAAYWDNPNRDANIHGWYDLHAST